MPTRRKPSETPRRGRPASTPEGREAQLGNLAVDLAEKQLREGTASSQVQIHYLKLVSTREKLEQERLRNEVSMLRAKVEAMGSAKKVEELYEDALKAMRGYQGQDEDDYEEDYYED